MTQPAEREAAKEIDEGLERDLRAVLGLDNEAPQDDQQPTENNQPEQEAQPPEEAPKGGEPESVDSSGEEEPPATPTWDLDGESVTADQVREWRKGYLRMDDYTRKTQRLSDRERELTSLEQRLQPLIQVEQMLAQNPQLFQTLQRALYGQVPGVQPGHQPMAQPQRGVQGQAVPQPAMIPPLPMGLGYNPALEQRLSKLEQIEADQQLDRTLQELRSRANSERQEFGLPALSDAEWSQVSTQLMNEALQQGVNDLSLVYRQSTLRDQWYREAIQKAREAALQEQREQQRRQAGAVMSGSPRGSQPAPSAQEPPKSFEEATRRAAAELRQSGMSLFVSD